MAEKVGDSQVESKKMDTAEEEEGQNDSEGELFEVEKIIGKSKIRVRFLYG